ncbi:MAG: ATP-dependent DNA helicase [Clostridiales bacterium]|nr:ATP-dependent DNA helicase [Clostridiales bacterium]
MRSISVSVTSLARFVSRTGNLSSAGAFGSVSGIQGTRLHKRIFADLKKQFGDEFETEHYFSHIFVYEDETEEIDLEVRGRADILFEKDQDGMPHIIEIKSFNSSKNRYEKLVHTDHEAQLKIYSALYFLDNPDLLSMNITLRYVNITSLEVVEKTESIERNKALDIYEDHVRSYIHFVKRLLQYDDNLYKSIREMAFPYESVRNGQKELMKTVLQSLSNTEVLFALAPTGTGKTISVLYPAVKGLLRNRYDKIFYLTAKEQTRVVAAKAINDMRSKGLLIRSITLKSKEQMCLLERKCDTKNCFYAKGYYDRLIPALSELLTHDELTPEIITRCALKYRLCPHELSLDAMNYCTVVIGDYNHAFDPRVSLIRAFDPEAEARNAVLIDEAHNMVDRSREMFSATLSKSLINRMQTTFKGRDPRIEGFLAQADHYLTQVRDLLTSNESAFNKLENIKEKDTLRTENFEGTTKRTLNLYTMLWRSIVYMMPVLDLLEPGDVRDNALDYFFETRFFLTVFEQEYDNNYITTFNVEDGDVTVSLVCLDASEKLRARIENIMPAVFFSATLSPYEYYRNVIVGRNCECVRHIELASPFPPENLEIMIDSSINTSYKYRKQTLPDLARRIYEELKFRHGNYMIFLPSFEYLDMVSSSVENLLKERADLKITKQRPSMTAIEKEDFLACYDNACSGLLVGFAVLGGHFGEGIDLVGEKLSGVIIVGVGLPKLSPERQILSNYYAEKFGDGFSFAYRFPGWEKVLQAVGRVIRTEEDTGFALLIDERLDKPEYLTLYPDNWKL